MNGIDPSGHAKAPNGATKGGGGNKTGGSGRLSQNNKTPTSTCTRQSPMKPPYTAPPTPPKPAPNYQKPTTYSSGAAKAAQSAKTASTPSSPAADFMLQTVADPYLALREATGQWQAAPVSVTQRVEAAKAYVRRTCDPNASHVSSGNSKGHALNGWDPIYKKDRWWQVFHSDEAFVQYAYESMSDYQNIQDDMKFLSEHTGSMMPSVNNFLVNMMDSVGLKPAERLEAYNNLYATFLFFIGDYNTEAGNMKALIYGPRYPDETRKQWLDYDGAEANAYLHVSWNAYMSYVTDADTAFGFALAHEVVGSTSSDDSEKGFLDAIANQGIAPLYDGMKDEYTGRDHIQMDLHNNEVGQRIGMLIPKGKNDIHRTLIEVAYNGNVQEYEYDISEEGDYKGLEDVQILIHYYVMEAIKKGDVIWLIE